MRKKQRNYKMTTSTELDYTRVIKITVGVLIVLALVYFLTALGMGEIDFNKKDKEESTETTIQYQEIISGEMLNRNASEYYVLIYDFEDTYASYYQTLISNYSATDNSLPFYTIDLNKKINEELKATEETEADSSLKVEDVALVKVVNGSSAEIIKGQEKVLEFFK